MKQARALLSVGMLLAFTIAVTGSNVAHADGAYFDLSVLPGIEVTGADIVNGLSEFVQAHPYRVVGTPSETLTAQALESEMRDLGYQTEIKPLAFTATDTTTVDVPLLHVVTAMKRGTSRPDDWIMFTAHIDTVPQTIFGTYDNGSGANMLRFLARELATVKTNRTLVFAWYNGEEEGAFASTTHSALLRAAGQSITAVLGFDMVGISWPLAVSNGSSCLCIWHGPLDGPRFKPLLQYVNYTYLGFPNGRRTVSLEGVNARNSDERTFAAQAYPTIRWAGLKTAAAYTAYHRPDDLMLTIDKLAGDHASFEQGSRNTLASGYYTALTLDNNPPVPAFSQSTDGLMLNVDASVSTDLDGALSDFSWDFGDGSTGTGTTASHVYASPGSYSVTLIVADNLWPAVTRTISATVTAG